MNKTTNFDLPIYEPTDITSWMGEDGFNGAMTKIDAGMAQNATAATGAQSTANNAIVNAKAAMNAANNAVLAFDSVDVTCLIPNYNAYIFASIDRNKQILLVNGYIEGNGAITSGNLLQTSIYPASNRQIHIGVYWYKGEEGGYVLTGFGVNSSFLTNGKIFIAGTNNNGHNFGIINWTLNVSTWGIR